MWIALDFVVSIWWNWDYSHTVCDAASGFSGNVMDLRDLQGSANTVEVRITVVWVWSTFSYKQK